MSGSIAEVGVGALRVQDVMTRAVVTAHEGATFKEVAAAADLLRENGLLAAETA